MKIDKFYVHIVRDGDRLRDCLTHTGEPMAEFYDTRHREGRVLWQFVSRYFVKTLLASEGGLCLMGGVPDWSLSGEDMQIVREFLTNEVKNDN